LSEQAAEHDVSEALPALADLPAALVEQAKQRAAAERRLEILEAELNEKTLRVHKLERRLDERFAELAELTRRLTDRETEMLRRVVSSERELLRASREREKSLRSQLQKLTKAQNALLTSTSWRITQPLRRIMAFIRGTTSSRDP
jgi:hypothetical protein